MRRAVAALALGVAASMSVAVPASAETHSFYGLGRVDRSQRHHIRRIIHRLPVCPHRSVRIGCKVRHAGRRHNMTVAVISYRGLIVNAAVRHNSLVYLEVED